MRSWTRFVSLALALVVQSGCTSPDPAAADDDAAACCSSTEGLGCGQPEIESCVCGSDAFCCEYGWDAACVVAVEDFGCATCPAGAIEAALEEERSTR
jgi:hypothetical protein